MPLRPARAACLKAPFTSSMVVFFSTSAVSSTTETSGVGTRSEMPSIFPFTSGITRLVALAAPVVVGSERKDRSEEHTSELQSRPHLVCRLLLEKKKYTSLADAYHIRGVGTAC